jgi:hypothetical protein
VYHGNWRQECENVQIMFVGEGYFAVYEGGFSGPSRIKGTAYNGPPLKKKEWMFELTQLSDPDEIKRYEKIFRQVREHGLPSHPITLEELEKSGEDI